MNTEKKERVAKSWLERYGESIDAPSLSELASVERLEGLRLDRYARLFLPQYADLLERQLREREALFDKRIPGTSTTYRERLDAFVRAHGRNSIPGSLYAPAALALIRTRAGQGGDQEAERVRSEAEMLRGFATEAWPESTGKAKADWALGCVAHEVSEWMAERSDTRTFDWQDVLTCLQWHGHELPAKAHPADSLRSAAQRFHNACETQPADA